MHFQGPVRESGVELTVRAMKLHPNGPRILRPACRTLANITITYSSLVEQILSPGKIQIKSKKVQILSGNPG